MYKFSEVGQVVNLSGSGSIKPDKLTVYPANYRFYWTCASK